ncbi:MAG: ATP-binding protein [Sandaracinaceae bacterium]
MAVPPHPSVDARSGPSPRTLLTHRYLVGLGLIAAILTLQVGAMSRQVDAARRDAEVVNRSGMQRMLTQRIGLLVRDLEASDGRAPRPRAVSEAQLEAAAETMRGNAAFLTEGEDPPAASSPALQERYEGPTGLSRRVETYAASASVVVGASRDGGEAAVFASPARAELIAAEQDLLAALHAAVEQHSGEAAARVDRFRRLERLFYAIGLVLLLLEAVLLFRPLIRRLDRTFGALGETVEELDSFSRRLSHDLRAPVASAQGFNNLVRDALADHDLDGARHAASKTDAALLRADTLIVDMVQLTRARLMGADEPLEPVDLGSAVTEAVGKVQHMVDEAGIDVAQHIAIDAPIATRRLLLQAAIDNLVSNAAKYRDPACAAPRIEVSVERDGAECVVRVDDNGLGVPPKSRDALFGAFQRFHQDASFGSGLGLYLTRKSVSALGGSVHYTPREVGSRFELRFPYVASERTRAA